MGRVMKLRDFATLEDERISAAVYSLCSGRHVQPEALAAACKMTKSKIYSRLRGETQWGAAEVADIAKFFDIRRDDLYDGLGGRVGPPPDGPLAQSVELRTFNPLSGNTEIAKVIPFRPRRIPQDLSFATGM